MSFLMDVASCSHYELESANTGNTHDELGAEDISKWCIYTYKDYQISK